MKSFWLKLLINLLAVMLFFGFAYFYRDEISRIGNDLFIDYPPCQKPIPYSILNLDPRFGLSEDDLLDSLKKAEEIWESAIDINLFQYSPKGDLKVSLIYDYRQETTEELKKLGIVIHQDKASYESLKDRYDALVASYDKEKSYLDGLVLAYERDKAVYEKQVKYWNSRGGAPKKEYESLEQMKADLSSQVAKINETQLSLNELAQTINSIAAALNKLVSRLNLQVEEYNSVGASTGGEFSEGEYVSNATGTSINIFQFSDRENLIRVLAHELGHALGLDHLDDPESIMYRLNEGTGNNLNEEDIYALKNLCGME